MRSRNPGIYCRSNRTYRRTFFYFLFTERHGTRVFSFFFIIKQSEADYHDDDARGEPDFQTNFYTHICTGTVRLPRVLRTAIMLLW